MKLLYILSLLTILSSCISDNTNNKTITIDIDAKQDKKLITDFQNKMEIRLLKLETVPDSYFSTLYVNKVILKGNDLYISDTQKNNLLIFDKTGLFKKRWSRYGRGPGEYISGLSSYYINDKKHLFIKDVNRIQEYDSQFNFIRSIPLSSKGFGFTKVNDKTIAIQRSVKEDHYLYFQDSLGNILKGLLPREYDITGNYRIANSSAFGVKADTIYLSRPLDNTVYLIANNSIVKRYNFDFGKYNVDGTIYEKENFLSTKEYRKYKESIIENIDCLQISDNWIAFCAFVNKSNNAIIYYNRSEDYYITNNNFTPPYSYFFGELNLPIGVTDNGEFYSFLSNIKLKEIIKNISSEYPDYESKYPFLKRIKLDNINEEDNDYLIFYKI